MCRTPLLELSARAPRRVRELPQPRPSDPGRPRSLMTDEALLVELAGAGAALRHALVGCTRSARAATVDARTGLAWSGLALLNAPFVDEPAHAERLARASLARRLGGRGAPVRGPVYLLRHVWERNHYHFLFDLVAQLQLAERAGIRRCLVDGALARDPWFELLIARNPAFDELELLVEERPVRVRELTFGRVGWADRETVAYVVDRLAPVAAAPGPDRRLFVARARGAGRAIANEDDIRPLLDELGFELVRPERLPPARQVELFAAGACVAGVHGAGLANVAFRGRRPLAVLELLPRSLVHPFYFNLCACLGARYEALVVDDDDASADARRRDITVDPRSLRAGLSALVAANGA